MSKEVQYPTRQEVNDFVYYDRKMLEFVNEFSQMVCDWANGVSYDEFLTRGPWQRRINAFFSSTAFKIKNPINDYACRLYIDEKGQTISIELLNKHTNLVYVIHKNTDKVFLP